MAKKLPHQSTVPPVDAQDVATKADGGEAEALQTTGASVDVAAAAPPSAGQILKATGATAATWQAESVGGGAADALATTGAEVNVAAAAPPSAGQILKATSATAATWQDGGGTHVAAEKIIHTIRTGDVESHDSATPQVVSQFQFDPTDYDMANATRSLVFRAVAANGGGVASTNVRLYNLTDGEAIATLNFTSASPVMVEATLTEGAGAGEVDLSAKIYEVRIFVDAPDAVDDTIELGSAEIRVINTID